MKRTPPPPEAGRNGLVWLVKEMTDLGPAHWYRYRVRGEIWVQGEFVDELLWHVPSVDDPAYYFLLGDAPAGPSCD